MRNGAETNAMKTIDLIYRLVFHVLTATVILTVAGSCMHELDADTKTGQEKEHIAFNTRFSGNDTKAATMTMLSGEAGVIGYIYGTWPSSAESIKTFAPWSELQDKSFTFDGDQLEATDGMVKWSVAEAEGKKISKDSKLKVYAYAPVEAEGMEVSYGTADNYTLPAISYTSPQAISEQTDIVTAVSVVATGFKKNIPLTFDHILTAIRFKAGFDCTVKSISISNVASAGTYVIGNGWNTPDTPQTYTISFGQEGKEFKTGDMITCDTDRNILFLIPQTFSQSSNAAITLNYSIGNTVQEPITTSLNGTWEEGQLITYTLHKKVTDTSTKTIYFDLAAGPVTINETSANGSVYVNGQQSNLTYSFKNETDGRFYIYQSTTLDGFPEFNKENTGFKNEDDRKKLRNCRIPKYKPVEKDDMLWSEWITNNTDVEGVINAWCNDNHAVAQAVGRTGTENTITVTGNLKCHITIDNLFSTTQLKYESGSTTGLSFTPSGRNSELTINIVGDNRFGNIRYWNGGTGRVNNGNKLIFEGTGSLTVADVVSDTATNSDSNTGVSATGHYGNHFNSAIGGSDHGTKGSEGIVINGGVIFAGTTAAENCSAIGGGGNGVGVVTINGGTVTAVAHTTGTAIGGGIGFSSAGGPGYVTITGGNIYAYNLENPHGIPSAAIGGAGSRDSGGSIGHVAISGGNIYAHAVGGTAIGGGSSKKVSGGEGSVTISGGNIIAKSAAGQVKGSNTAGAGIGGGTGGSNPGANGGKATVTITGNPIIRTGSIGGGKTNSTSGRIGSATIDISGGDIQAQFVMAAGAEIKPSFTMTGGLIRNSDTEDDEYAHIQDNGGAVYLEDGTFKMSGGEIRRCSALKGGAIYIKGTASTEFEMTGGKITECASKMDGGAVYLEGGVVTLAGGEVSHNLANNGNGGGFCIVGGNFSMPESGTAQIFENAAFSQNNKGGKGGGIYVTSTGSNVNVNILSGQITENSSDRHGGGLAVDIPVNDTEKEETTASVTVGMSNGGNESPSISSNHTIVTGGGLYAKGKNANITINSGKIKENTISGYVSNPDVANEGGMVTLNGGDVTHVVVTYNNNGSYLGQAVKKATQKIVTATNSTMAVPEEFTLLGYKLEGWNTRPDGKGTDYIEGQTMNLSANLTLYAQWSRN